MNGASQVREDGRMGQNPLRSFRASLRGRLLIVCLRS